MKPRLIYGNGTWACRLSPAWGVGTTPEEAFRRWQTIAKKLGPIQ